MKAPKIARTVQLKAAFLVCTILLESLRRATSRRQMLKSHVLAYTPTVFRTLRIALLLLPVSLGLAQNVHPDLQGQWLGTLSTLGLDPTIRLEIAESRGKLTGRLLFIEDAFQVPLSKIEVKDRTLRIRLKDTVEFANQSSRSLSAEWNADGPTLTGRLDGTTATFVLKRDVAGPPGDIRVEALSPARIFRGGDRFRLAYELRISNFTSADITVRSIEYPDMGVTIKGKDLREALQSSTILWGTTATAFLWLSTDDLDHVSASVSHRLTFDRDMTAEGEVSIVLEKPVILSPPLRGADWVAGNGPSNDSPHRRALLPLGGKLWSAQKYAIDWYQVTEKGKEYKGDRKKNSSYPSYGAEVLAVADATVVGVQDGIPENVPGPASRAVEMSRDTLPGNYVVLDLGNEVYALYAHLQPGSLRVKAGGTVTRGAVLGLVGNSGNSTGPHLHFHVMDNPSPLLSNGLPYLIAGFDVLNDKKMYEHREEQIPLNGEVVRFP